MLILKRHRPSLVLELPKLQTEKARSAQVVAALPQRPRLELRLQNLWTSKVPLAQAKPTQPRSPRLKVCLVAWRWAPTKPSSHRLRAIQLKPMVLQKQKVPAGMSRRSQFLRSLLAQLPVRNSPPRTLLSTDLARPHHLPQC